MKTRRQRFALPLALALTLASFSVFSAATPRAAQAAAAPTAQEPQQYGALERGYRTGYSDGFQSGWGDSLKRAPYEFKNKADYQRADRAYIAAYGAREDYRDGYQQGFEVGYEAGFNRGGFDSNVPPGLSRRGASPEGVADSNGGSRGGRSGDVAESSSDPNDRQAGAQTTGGVSATVGTSPIPGNTVLLVELMNRLSTDVSQRGDRFEARVIEPQEFEGAIVGGRLTNVERAGKATGRSQLQLDFDQIRMPGSGNWEQLSAQVVEIVPVGGEGNGEEVDEEGGVRGKSTTKEDAIKVGGAAGIGAIIGAIAGGGKGAGIGAVIGGAAGTGAVMTQRGKDIRFEPGQQLRIRTSGR
ncbi:MAG TPA: hypothetical protein VFS10_13655 [Pyrinomonadaceae bacterium]|nr:hypothetical protein [Pyrinomonadaceae bacterium]